ncbi:hypothetical protein [Paractinoplanes lichenicola]|uniref:Uncharacterized protein n=1 Tax=Paractinoplanes lichenicola TaxID=2802976 RepID=A0ABS1VWU8_9ACTN|nr:hypothetical protein [Actinoplanes lichenicola]MBL7258960.1 hypothetical protein [Actinoplanes lichenicola]
MQSSTETHVAVAEVEPAEAEPAPAAPLILLEPLEGDSAVCGPDGWCD